MSLAARDSARRVSVFFLVLFFGYDAVVNVVVVSVCRDLSVHLCRSLGGGAAVVATRGRDSRG